MNGGMRFWAGMLAGLALMATPAWAAEATGARAAAQTGPLKPGKSAGVQAAQQKRTGLALISAGAIIAVVVVAAGTGGGNNNGQQPNSQFAPTTTSP
jgi:hypothetical protein